MFAAEDSKPAIIFMCEFSNKCTFGSEAIIDCCFTDQPDMRIIINISCQSVSVTYDRYNISFLGSGRMIAAMGRNPPPPPLLPSSSSFLVRHTPVKILSTAKKKYPSKRCVICYRNGRRVESRVECRQCLARPALCVNPCFYIYHAVIK